MNILGINNQVLICLFMMLEASCNQTEKNNTQLFALNASMEESKVQSDATNLLSTIATNNKCLSCHMGIEPIRDPKPRMMQKICKLAKRAGYKNNECIVCLSLCITMI